MVRKGVQEGTHFIFEIPFTNPTTQGRTWTSILLTRNGTLETSAQMKSVSKCFAASFYDVPRPSQPGAARARVRKGDGTSRWASMILQRRKSRWKKCRTERLAFLSVRRPG